MRKPVPNLSTRSGLSRDFRLALGSLANYLERVADGDPPRTRHLARRAFLHRSVPRYTEYFAPAEYAEVVVESNREAVERLDDLVARVNQLREAEDTTPEVLEGLYAQILMLLDGDGPP